MCAVALLWALRDTPVTTQQGFIIIIVIVWNYFFGFTCLLKHHSKSQYNNYKIINMHSTDNNRYGFHNNLTKNLVWNTFWKSSWLLWCLFSIFLMEMLFFRRWTESDPIRQAFCFCFNNFTSYFIGTEWRPHQLNSVKTECKHAGIDPICIRIP